MSSGGNPPTPGISRSITYWGMFLSPCPYPGRGPYIIGCFGDSGSITADPLPQLGDFPLVVAAEGKHRLQCREGASAERALEAGELGEGGANLLGIDRNVA